MHKVIHQEKDKRFSLKVDGWECFIDYRVHQANVWDFHHTYVPPELRGRGLAEILTQQSLTYAQSHHIQIIPSCPYVAKFMDKHPEFTPLIHASFSII